MIIRDSGQWILREVRHRQTETSVRSDLRHITDRNRRNVSDSKKCLRPASNVLGLDTDIVPEEAIRSRECAYDRHIRQRFAPEGVMLAVRTGKRKIQSLYRAAVSVKNSLIWVAGRPERFVSMRYEEIPVRG